MINNAGLVVQANAWVAAYPYVSIHVSGTPSSPGAESTAARQLAGWAVDADGDISLPSDVNFTGGAANGPAVLVMYHSASSGGSTGGGQLLDTNPPNDTTFNAAGEATLKAGLSESNTST
jgi:hypothetical protein